MESKEYFKKYISTDYRTGTTPLDGQYRSDEKVHWLPNLINSLPELEDVFDPLVQVAIIIMGLALFLSLLNIENIV